MLLHLIVKHGIASNVSVAKVLCEGVLRDDGLHLKLKTTWVRTFLKRIGLSY